MIWQRSLRPLLRWLLGKLRSQGDLLCAGVVLFLLHGFLDRTSFLAQGDWRPWLTLNLSVAAFLRGRSLGLGPHPGLRAAPTGGLVASVIAALAPWWTLCAAEAARGSEQALRQLTTLSIIALVLIMRRRRRLRSAWRPQVRAAMLLSLSGAVALGALIFLARGVGPGSLWALASASVLAVSLALGDPHNLCQRWASWEGRPEIGVPKNEIIVLGSLVFLPAAGLELIPWLMLSPELNPQADQLPSDGFVWAALATIYVMVWAAMMWGEERPTGLACLLREVEPVGGIERRRRDAEALDFSDAPQGALAVEPLGVKRSPRFHPWYVPVDSGRAASAELSSRPLWNISEPSTGHALGDAHCAEDGIPGLLPLSQWSEVTIDPYAQESRESLAESKSGVRRQVVLRPFHRWLNPPLSTLPPTFSWESAAAHRLFQLNIGRPLRLSDGDVLVLSSAGIVRCFEFEAGAPINLAGVRHVPQPEDYLEAGS